MQPNIPSKAEVNDMVSAYIEYLKHNPYAALEAELHGQQIVIIAAVDPDNDESMQPMFVIPSPELILSIVDPVTKEAVFGVANPN